MTSLDMFYLAAFAPIILGCLLAASVYYVSSVRLGWTRINAVGYLARREAKTRAPRSTILPPKPKGVYTVDRNGVVYTDRDAYLSTLKRHHEQWTDAMAKATKELNASAQSPKLALVWSEPLDERITRVN